MLPSRHIIATLPISVIVWSVTESFVAGLLCFISGILIDVDHCIDYLIHYGLKPFNLNDVYGHCAKIIDGSKSDGKVYVFFHATEIAVLLWINFMINKNIYFFSIALGYTIHLILDICNNTMKPWAYFISLRIKNKFATTKLMNPRVKSSY